MSAGWQRRWSHVLLAVLGLTLAGAVSEALAACHDCCHERPAREATPCQSAVSIQCCDGTLALPATNPASPEPLRAPASAPASLSVPEPTVRLARQVALPPPLVSILGCVILRL